MFVLTKLGPFIAAVLESVAQFTIVISLTPTEPSAADRKFANALPGIFNRQFLEYIRGKPDALKELPALVPLVAEEFPSSLQLLTLAPSAIHTMLNALPEHMMWHECVIALAEAEIPFTEVLFAAFSSRQYSQCEPAPGANPDPASVLIAETHLISKLGKLIKFPPNSQTG